MTRSLLIRALFAGAIIALGAVAANAQGVLIAPNVVVIDARTRSTAVTLVNNGVEPAEVNIGAQFGYPMTDSSGAMFLKTFETVPDSIPSAANWVRAFPQRLILAAGERRAVRVLVTPPASLPTGEYWSRLVVTTRAANARLASTEGTQGVQIGLNLEVRSLVPLFYRNGPVNTGVAIGQLSASVVRDSIALRVPLRREGNAAFVGSIHATIRDAKGTVVVRDSLPLGVYYDLAPRMMLKRRSLAAGHYTVSVDAIASRPDVNASLVLPAKPSQAKTELDVPEGR
ncbi:MAG TPA: hypothetical protein VGM82_02630 [Gemmatimonadaceae bacterium]|jgi:P pilus assembly chaperone PapD